MDCPWTDHGQCMDCSWTVHGLSIDCPWTVRGQPMDCLWTVYGLSMGCPWTVHGLSMDSPWTVRGLSVESRTVHRETRGIPSRGFQLTIWFVPLASWWVDHRPLHKKTVVFLNYLFLCKNLVVRQISTDVLYNFVGS